MPDPQVQAVRRRRIGATIVTETLNDHQWKPWPAHSPQPLGLPDAPAWRDDSWAQHGDDLLPFAPISFRDFMLYEQHVIDASRAMARRYLPAAYKLGGGYEWFTKSTFPKFKPSRLWYDQPIYYLSNALTMVPTGTTINPPSYANDLDYELELGFVINRPLKDATPAEAMEAIAGYVVLNDLSMRDVQLAEMRSGFGPQKAKHFLSSMSANLIAASEIRDPTALGGSVTLNGHVVTRTSTAGMQHSLGEAIAHASKGEQLFPGELFRTGTLPGCSGLENGRLLVPGDRLELTIEGIGTITHNIAPRLENLKRNAPR